MCRKVLEKGSKKEVQERRILFLAFFSPLVANGLKIVANGPQHGADGSQNGANGNQNGLIVDPNQHKYIKKM